MLLKAAQYPATREGRLILRSQPLIHALLQKVQGQCTRAKHFVMKGADIKVLAELILGALAQRQHFQLADSCTPALAQGCRCSDQSH